MAVGAGSVWEKDKVLITETITKQKRVRMQGQSK